MIYSGFIGVDPGLSGAVAVITASGEVHFHDQPVTKILKGTKRSKTTGKTTKQWNREYDAALMASILEPYQGFYVGLELVGSMPKQGVASTFKFGKGYGIWIGILAALKLPYELIRPQDWQKIVGVKSKGGKGASVLRARQLAPSFAEEIKNDGRADALLIAEAMRRKMAVS